MISPSTTHEKLNHLIQKVLAGLVDKLIYEDENQWVLFERYKIIKKENVFEVTKSGTYIKHSFHVLRHATAWCILDKYNKIIPAKRIIELDKILAGKLWDRENHIRLQRKINNYEVYRDKMLFDISRQKQILDELDKYINMAKKCQQQGYENDFT